MNKYNLLLLLVAWILSGCSSIKTIGSAQWQNASVSSARGIIEKEMPQYAASVFLLRSADSTSAHNSDLFVALNKRFQISLQPGHFSHTYACAGTNEISVGITSDLNNNKKRVTHTAPVFLSSKTEQFFEVRLNSQEQIDIVPLPYETALTMLDHMPLQSHQVSRVFLGCSANVDLQILFDSGQSTVNDSYYRQIASVAEYMKQHPEVTVTLEGHADSNEYVLGLSRNRAQSVRSLLVKKYGVSSQKIKIIAYDKRSPIVNNATPEGRKYNRRVIAILSK